MRIISLDFDGVTHPSSPCSRRVDTPHFGWLQCLVHLLVPHPDVRILVHSSWREVYSLSELQAILESDLVDRVIGAAPPGDDKYAAIWTWIETNAPGAALLVLDDEATAFPAQTPPELLLCDPCKGLSDPRVQEALTAWLESTSVIGSE